MTLSVESWEGYHYKIRFFYSFINYWFKILEVEENRHIRYAYQLMLNDVENKPNCVNWASRVKFLLSSLGFYEVWVNQGGGNKSAFLWAFRQRLTDSFMQDWNSRLLESSRANFYSLFSTRNLNINHLALFSLRTESDNPDATCELCS